ncbi:MULTISPECIES: FAD-dependent monooxygenase [unclassified Streptomyces]|uniref:FAD-dependent monooxygenase n=1 Tax=unclassified Streptomyces TaxID=2593676 RepID=UPI001F04A836|nr:MULTISPECIES: FAD-dependent monooxygenase [unclassified Streptomyces]MCH0564624.1 FAD-dependent monooxygenase [Streptomyces sp. MUM 2J]MCH0573317.1 FAD-dependent monooxygenase [Streptomyces sp. MUM 136J]
MGHTGMDADVVIAGAGPTGLMLACELRLAGVDVVVVDRLAQRTGESRAGGMHCRTLEVLDQRGVLGRFLAAGDLTPVGHFSGLMLDFDGLETRHPLPLMILQSAIERLLEEWAAGLGTRVRWSSEVVGVRQDEDGVAVELRTADAAPVTLRARYLVGCDGGRSTVRKLSGIAFPGTPATMTALIGDVELPDLPEDYIWARRCATGDYSAISLEPGWYRVITSDHDQVVDRDEPATFEQLRQSLIRLAGTDYGMRRPRWISRFGDAARQAARYRAGRVLLAGDAAHIHFPAGGQGLNTGVQDAVNLGWKLASVVRGQTPESLLDTYHTERHPVGERVLQNTRAQAALARPGAQTDALRDVFGSLLVLDDVNRRLREMLTALDIRYPVGDGHPLAGRRVPDAGLKAPDGTSRVYELLHAARPVLLDLHGSPELVTAVEGWADRVDLVEARSEDEQWAVPSRGEIPAPAAVLIRPDGHVAWAAATGRAPDTSALRTALTTWFGPARQS